MNKSKLYFILFMLSSAIASLRAQVDPARVAVIMQYSDKAQKALKAQEAAMAGMTTGHIWLQEEIEATTNFQREFNEYLDNFHDVLSIAAEVYGIYYEVRQTAKVVKELQDVLSVSPSNALAVAFSTRRNVIYRNIVHNGTDLVMDIRTLCFGSAKMTEAERIKIISSIRPKLHQMNKQLRVLAIALRYTTFLDVWNEIRDRALDYVTPATKAEIAARCIRDWRNNVKSGMKTH